MDTNTTARTNPFTAWWSTRTSAEKVAASLAAAVVGLVLGAGLGMGVAAAVGGEAPTDGAAPVPDGPAPEAPRPAPSVPPTTTVPATTTTMVPAPAPTVPPTTTTVDPRPARRAEIADDVRVLNAAIDQRRSEINAQRVAEVEACAAESDRLEQDYLDRQAETVQARAAHDVIERDLITYVHTNPLRMAIGPDGLLADPTAQRFQLAHLAAVETLEAAEAAEQDALDAGVAHGEMCAAQRAGYGPIDEDPEIQELMARRQALIAEYESLG